MDVQPNKSKVQHPMSLLHFDGLGFPVISSAVPPLVHLLTPVQVSGDITVGMNIIPTSLLNIDRPACCSPGVSGQRFASLALDSSDYPNETSVVAEAAKSGSGTMVDTVVAAMSDVMSVEKVRVVIGL